MKQSVLKMLCKKFIFMRMIWRRWILMVCWQNEIRNPKIFAPKIFSNIPSSLIRTILILNGLFNIDILISFTRCTSSSYRYYVWATFELIAGCSDFFFGIGNQKHPSSCCCCCSFLVLVWFFLLYCISKNFKILTKWCTVFSAKVLVQTKLYLSGQYFIHYRRRSWIQVCLLSKCWIFPKLEKVGKDTFFLASQYQYPSVFGECRLLTRRHSTTSSYSNSRGSRVATLLLLLASYK